MTSPVGFALGAQGTPMQCRVISDDIAVHWYPQDAQSGDCCLCGKVTMRDSRD